MKTMIQVEQPSGVSSRGMVDFDDRYLLAWAIIGVLCGAKWSKKKANKQQPDPADIRLREASEQGWKK